MPFTVPNENVATLAVQARLDSGDLDAMMAPAFGSGVFSGCLVTAQGTPDGTVAVSTGSVRITGSTQAVTGANVSVLTGSANADGTTASAAHANWLRYDLIVVNASGQLGVLHGQVTIPVHPNYIHNPVFPTWNKATQVPLAALVILPGSEPTTGTIRTADIVQKDPDINANAFHDQIHTIWGANHQGTLLISQLPSIFIPVPFSHVGTAVVATGALRWANKSGRTLTINSIFASANTAPVGTTSTPISGAGLVFDVNIDASTIWSTQGNRVNIQAAAISGSTTTFNTTTIADGSYLSVDTDFIGSTTPGADIDVQVWLRG
jgi:hypothetical protein